ncbi:MAG TPA: hypothetical protein HPP54_08995 [Nitrospinae bacterium]|nr:hypothetical protein [Nitrospinota bacterium]
MQKLKRLLLKNTSAPGPTNQKIYIVVIGVSTGDSNALAELFPTLPGDLPVPIVLVQHMPHFLQNFWLKGYRVNRLQIFRRKKLRNKTLFFKY